MSMCTVVKIGGSLCADPVRLHALLASLAEGAFGPCLVVPGGGAHADAVRAAQLREGFGDAEAHRRALDAMSRMAADFHAIEPRLPRRGYRMQTSGEVRRGSLLPWGEGQDEGRELSGEVTPLTPTLSPWEREPRNASNDLSAAVTRSCVNPVVRRGGKEDSRSAGTETWNLIWDPVALRSGHPDIPETWDVTSDSLAVWAATQIRAARCLLVKSADAPAGADARDLACLGLVDAAFPAFAARYGGHIAILGPGGETPIHPRDAA